MPERGQDSAAVDRYPLGVRDSADAIAEYEMLVEGIPARLEGSVWRWVMDRATKGAVLERRVERILDISLPQPTQRESSFAQYWSSANAEDRLRLVDFLLHDLQEEYDRSLPDRQKVIQVVVNQLADSRAGWHPRHAST